MNNYANRNASQRYKAARSLTGLIPVEMWMSKLHEIHQRIGSDYHLKTRRVGNFIQYRVVKARVIDTQQNLF